MMREDGQRRGGRGIQTLIDALEAAVEEEVVLEFYRDFMVHQCAEETKPSAFPQHCSFLLLRLQHSQPSILPILIGSRVPLLSFRVVSSPSKQPHNPPTQYPTVPAPNPPSTSHTPFDPPRHHAEKRLPKKQHISSLSSFVVGWYRSGVNVRAGVTGSSTGRN